MPRQEPRNPNRHAMKGKELVKEYLEAKHLFEHRLWHLVGGKWVTNYEGQYVTGKEFKKMFPILSQSPLYINTQNPNKSNNYTSL